MIKLFTVTMDASAKDLVGQVLGSGYVAQGPQVDRFELELERFAMTSGKVVAVNSGTAALDLAYELIGIGPGDEVISTPMTCAATNLPLLHRRAKIVWCDVDKRTGNADPEDVARKVTDKTKAIVVVDWGGLTVDHQASFYQVGRSIPVVVDAAHSFPKHRHLHTYYAHSFQAIKFLTTGDGGGLVLPAYRGLDARAKRLRWFGFDRTSKEDFRSAQQLEEAGFKYHMNDIAAAIGISNIRAAKHARDQAQNIARYYRTRLIELAGRSRLLALPPDADHRDWWLFTILVEDRDAFVAFMKRRGIECSQVHTRNDRHPVFVQNYGEADLPGVDYFSKYQVAIPVHAKLSSSDCDVIANAVEDWAMGSTR